MGAASEKIVAPQAPLVKNDRAGGAHQVKCNAEGAAGLQLRSDLHNVAGSSRWMTVVLASGLHLLALLFT